MEADRTPGSSRILFEEGGAAQTLQVGLHDQGIGKGERSKTRHRTRNWREYDWGLILHGDLTVWISPDLAWHAAASTGRRVRPPTFSDTAIQAVLTPKVLH
jgi:hypothetical protein